MAIREFTDESGRRWQVWATIPESPREERIFEQSARLLAEARQRDPAAARGRRGAPAGRFSPGREHGWLTFMAGDEKRRLSPVPEGWESASDAVLSRWLAEAEPARLSENAARILEQHRVTGPPEGDAAP
ncbi:MAG TPA: hypothetical protein VFS05_05610 [Gemmatimonadaceae bacterium]|nr:hypothetical protein [Gemmatimonadaceae bacterium]